MVSFKIYIKEAMAKKFGISKENLYLIHDTAEKDDQLFLKLHNPFNTFDELE